MEATAWVAFLGNIFKQFIFDFSQNAQHCKNIHNPPKPIAPLAIMIPQNLLGNSDASFVALVTSKVDCKNVCTKGGREGINVKIILPTV